MLQSGLVTEDDVLPMGHCQVLPPLRPLQAERVVVASQQGFLCGSINLVTTGQEPVVDGFPASPHSIQIPHPCRHSPSTYEAILLDHPQQSPVLTRCGLPRRPWELAWHQSSSGSMLPVDAVDGSTSQTPATSNSTLTHALMSKCKHFMPNTYRGWVEHYQNNQWELRKNMQLLIRTCHSAKADLWKWSPKLQFWTSTIPLGIEVKVWSR